MPPLKEMSKAAGSRPSPLPSPRGRGSTGLPVLPSAPPPVEPFDFAAIRAKVAGERGKAYWRSLEELAGSPEFEEFLAREFPENVVSGFDRRELFKFLGASLALAGLTACTRQPTEKIVPYVRAPENIVPGEPLFFATAMTLSGYATGLLAESHMGRPTKIEGNPLHPASLGATDAFSQASVFTLYDPDRSQTLLYLDEIRPWASFLGEMRKVLEAERGRGGAGLRILTETVSSPTLARQIANLLSAFPNARWHQWEPANRDNALDGARLAFGEPLGAIYRLANADVILSLDGDFLSCGPGHLRYVRQFTDKRRVTPENPTMSRLYAVESTPTTTGAKADHRLRVRAGEVESFARGVAAALESGSSPSPASSFLSLLVKDLQSHRGSSLVVAGDSAPPAVHALAHAMNALLGNAGPTVEYTEPVVANPETQLESLTDLARDMDAGRVETLVILGGNPVFTAPADLAFGERLRKVKLRVHASLYTDETSALCHWHIPEAHFLESWSDARAFDGTASIVQPLIAPLYAGRTHHEVLAAFSEEPERSSYDLVRETWRSRMEGDFEGAWRKALYDGVIEGTAAKPKAVTPRRVDTVGAELAPARGRPQGPPLRPDESIESAPDLEIIFRPDPTIHDGSFANNGWLQELPKPLTKLTWDNAAIFSVATAKRVGLAKEDVVLLRFRGRSVEAPAWIEPGQPDDSVTVHFGHGRTRGGKLGTKTGFDAYAIRPSDSLWFGRGLEVSKTGRRWQLACTQPHHTMEGRHLVRSATLSEYRSNPDFASDVEKQPPPELSLYPHYKSDTYAWAMAIDVNACIGCNACVVACQAENNIPVVGKEEVVRGREMQWLRIDHYYSGEAENPEHYFQPVPCMHCEKAPCEVVCPTAATVHSAEGLNDMIYNRCVGTRYCSNNCPYKVRRFNFYHYSTQFRAPSMKMLANPDVTVRWRGVMEKCTYCVQRIMKGRIDAELENRRVRDGEITTACAQACAAEAIVFGDMNDPASRVARWKKDPRGYALLSELGTRPRTTYLAAVKNPNPELPPEQGNPSPPAPLPRGEGRAG